MVTGNVERRGRSGSMGSLMTSVVIRVLSNGYILSLVFTMVVTVTVRQDRL